MQNFVRFHAIESEIEQPQQFRKKRNNSVPYRAIYTQIASLLFLMIYIFYTNFYPISSARNRDQRIPKITGKGKLQRHFLSDLRQKLIEPNLQLDITKYEIS